VGHSRLLLIDGATSAVACFSPLGHHPHLSARLSADLGRSGPQSVSQVRQFALDAVCSSGLGWTSDASGLV